MSQYLSSELFQKDTCAPSFPKQSKETSQASQEGVDPSMPQKANLCVRVLLPCSHHDSEKSLPDSAKALGTAIYFFLKSMLAREATLFSLELKKWVPPVQCSKMQPSLQESSVLPTNSPSRTPLAWQSAPHRPSLSAGPWELNNLHILTCLQFEPLHSKSRPIAHLPSHPTSFQISQHSQISASLPLCFPSGDFSLLTALSYQAREVKTHRLFHFPESSSF